MLPEPLFKRQPNRRTVPRPRRLFDGCMRFDGIERTDRENRRAGAIELHDAQFQRLISMLFVPVFGHPHHSLQRLAGNVVLGPLPAGMIGHALRHAGRNIDQQHHGRTKPLRRLRQVDMGNRLSRLRLGRRPG